MRKFLGKGTTQRKEQIIPGGTCGNILKSWEQLVLRLARVTVNGGSEEKETENKE